MSLPPSHVRHQSTSTCVSWSGRRRWSNACRSSKPCPQGKALNAWPAHPSHGRTAGGQAHKERIDCEDQSDLEFAITAVRHSIILNINLSAMGERVLNHKTIKLTVKLIYLKLNYI